MKNFFRKKDKVQENFETDSFQDSESLTKSLGNNIRLLNAIFSKDDTIVVRQFENKFLKSAKCCVIFIKGMADNDFINENIIKPILVHDLRGHIDESNLLEELQRKIIAANDVEATTNIEELVNAVMEGDTLLLLDGYQVVLKIGTKGWKTRSIEEPPSEKIVRGPREGFTESIIINQSLLRRKIKNSDLKFQYKEIGTRTHTRTCLCYIESLASDEVLKELNKRLEAINIDAILDSGYIQEMIKDSPLSPFETVGSTERPDVLAAKLLEGRIGIMVDGSPFALTVPFIMIEYFQTNEDYYNNFFFASINRILRLVGGLLSVTVPALYVSLVTYNQEMIPTPLILSISAARQGLPFPTIVETLIMLLVFEILREAGTRIPVPIGQAINIVGALVLGQAVVQARLVSAPIVIVTALTGISSLFIMNLLGASIIFRTIFLLLASFMGMYGLIFGLLGIIIYLMDMRSFGVPYMLSVLSFDKQDMKDTMIRVPWWQMKFRPKLISAKDHIRQSAKK